MSLKKAWKALIGKEETISIPEKVAKDPRCNHEFTEEDRFHSAEMRRMRQEQQRIQMKMQHLQMKRDLEELKAEFEEEEEEGGDDNSEMLTQFLSILTAAKGGVQQNPYNPQQNMNSYVEMPPSMPQEQQSQMISDEEIRQFLKQQDKGKIRLAKTMPKAIVKSQAMQQTGIDENTAERAYQILMAEF